MQCIFGVHPLWFAHCCLPSCQASVQSAHCLSIPWTTCMMCTWGTSAVVQSLPFTIASSLCVLSTHSMSATMCAWGAPATHMSLSLQLEPVHGISAFPIVCCIACLAVLHASLHAWPSIASTSVATVQPKTKVQT